LSAVAFLLPAEVTPKWKPLSKIIPHAFRNSIVSRTRTAMFSIPKMSLERHYTVLTPQQQQARQAHHDRVQRLKDDCESWQYSESLYRLVPHSEVLSYGPSAEGGAVEQGSSAAAGVAALT
jgi:hypothetical protein